MQLVTFEAERSSDFSPDLIELAKRESEKATAELHHLSELKDLTRENIDAVVFGELGSRSALSETNTASPPRNSASIA